MALWTAAATASPAPAFTWPAACEPGLDCWVVRYVDRDPGPGARDPFCGELTGDGHKGTDIALADLARLAAGVRVLSPAAGRVVGVRDGMPDIAVDAPGAPDLAGRSCGNGVRIAHADGWVSQLCHLRRGSLLVAEGDAVEADQPVGLVGLSGETTFPHVHWSLWHEGRLVDPYDGARVDEGAACATGNAALLEDAPDYLALPLVGVGFAPAAPEDVDLFRGWHRETALPATAPALVLWAHGYGTRVGDRLRFVVEGPGGPVLSRTVGVERDRARATYFVGARRPEGGWPPGRYTGRITWTRADETVERTVVLDMAQP